MWKGPHRVRPIAPVTALGAQGYVCVPYPEVPTHFLLQGLQELEGEGLVQRHVSTGHRAEEAQAAPVAKVRYIR